MTISSDFKLTDNKKMVFNETNIGPGFTNDYNINITNNSSEKIFIYVDSIKVKSDIENINEFYFKFGEGSLLQSGDIKKFTPDTPAVFSVSENTSGVLRLNLELDKNAGNEYQDSEITFHMTFRISSDVDNAQTGINFNNTRTWIIAILIIMIITIGYLITRKNREKVRNEVR
ncbi:MAG: hypothetical protein GX896_07360 [Clostridiales bacterium]|nr:hypothetical protein [Clostridiales bacterium]